MDENVVWEKKYNRRDIGKKCQNGRFYSVDVDSSQIAGVHTKQRKSPFCDLLNQSINSKCRWLFCEFSRAVSNTTARKLRKRKNVWRVWCRTGVATCPQVSRETRTIAYCTATVLAFQSPIYATVTTKATVRNSQSVCICNGYAAFWSNKEYYL